MIKKTIRAAVCVIALASPASAWAQAHAGVRAGVSGAPGQFVFGAHIETRPLIEHLTFRPNAEVGVGDGQTTAGVNFEFAYWMRMQRHPWSVYMGGGPAVVFASRRIDRADHAEHVGGGFNVMLGIQHRRGLFTEIKVGFISSPQVKWCVGYAFR
jgi:hypothetical protein